MDIDIIWDILSAILLILGSFFMLLACVGVFRLPDLYIRMSAATKAGTLGAAGVLFGAALQFRDIQVLTLSVATIAFLLLTAPVAAHMIGRSAYIHGVPLWSKSVVDDLQGKYKPKSGELDGFTPDE